MGVTPRPALAPRYTKRLKTNSGSSTDNCTTLRLRKKKNIQMAPRTPEMTPEAPREPSPETAAAPPEAAVVESVEAVAEAEAQVEAQVESITEAQTESIAESHAEASSDPREIMTESSTWPEQMWKVKRLLKKLGGESSTKEGVFLVETIRIICRMMEVEPYETVPAAHEILMAMPAKSSLDRFLKLLAHMAANPQLVNDQPVLHVLARLLRDIQRAWHIHFPVDTVSLTAPTPATSQTDMSTPGR
jgi:hypothetical protein